MHVVQERDYIRHKKSSGYRVTIVVSTVDTIDGMKRSLAEI